jgi:hypothetical protein
LELTRKNIFLSKVEIATRGQKVEKFNLLSSFASKAPFDEKFGKGKISNGKRSPGKKLSCLLKS